MIILCYSEFLEWSQCNKWCGSHSWGGKHAEKHCDHSVRHSINRIQNLTAWSWPHLIKRRLSYRQFASGANHTVTTWGVWVISESGSGIKDKVRKKIALLTEFFVVCAWKISVCMSPYWCIKTLKLPRESFCAVHHNSTENLTTCMIPHYPQSAVSQLPHCPLQCHFWLS